MEPSSLSSEESTIPAIDGTQYAVSEGNRTLALHYRRERNRTLVEAKKRVVEAEKGYLACEVCDLDFCLLSPRYGLACCEVHHLSPLALGPTAEPTPLSDLAIVCSNCHRMIHRSDPPLAVAMLRQDLHKGTKPGLAADGGQRCFTARCSRQRLAVVRPPPLKQGRWGVPGQTHPA